MNDKERQDFEDLQKRVKELSEELNNFTRKKQEYANRDVFDSSVTFKKPVYDRFGKRIIN